MILDPISFVSDAGAAYDRVVDVSLSEAPDFDEIGAVVRITVALQPDP